MGLTVPKSEIKVLNQLIDNERGIYRIRARLRVHYVTITTSTFDDYIMCRPFLLVPQLPDFPDTDWTTMRICRGLDNVVESTIAHDELPKISHLWHNCFVDILSLEHIKRFKSNVHEVMYQGRPAISKIALFEWDFGRIENETWVYATLSDDRDQNPAMTPCAPKFLGHLTENGRVIGFLLEKVDGDFASIADLPNCESLLQRIHGMGIIHGDVNRYNFIINRSSGNVHAIDFEHSEDFDEAKACRELETLASKLTEETGRGAPARMTTVM